MYLATSSNLVTCCLCYRMPQNTFFPRTHDLLVSKKTMQRHFFQPSTPFPGKFCNCNARGICSASQFKVQLPLYILWSNTYSEIGLEVMLRPLATSCMKDYKGHSLVQTSFTEPPNTDEVVIMCGCVKDGFQFFVSADARSVQMLMT